MCFTPKISFLTAAIEFITAGYIYFHYPKTTLVKFLTVIITLLGFYQFTEFMLCTTGNAQLWGTLGFITYTFLPPIGLHFALAYRKDAVNKFFIYIFPISFTAIALLTDNFITSGTCATFFVSVENAFFNSVGSATRLIIYITYYFSFIVLTCLLLYKDIRQKKQKRYISAIFLATIILTLLPPLVLMIIFPALLIQFPSIYCQFAILFTVTALWCVYLENKERKASK